MFFTIDWPHNHIFGAEHLKLAFEDVAEAELWHRELERAIGAPRLRAVHCIHVESDFSGRCAALRRYDMLKVSSVVEVVEIR